MVNLIHRLAILDLRVHQSNPVLKKRWQISTGKVTILIDCRGEHGATMLPIPSGIIGTATKKRNSKWSPANDNSALNYLLSLFTIPSTSIDSRPWQKGFGTRIVFRGANIQKLALRYKAEQTLADQFRQDIHFQ